MRSAASSWPPCRIAGMAANHLASVCARQTPRAARRAARVSRRRRRQRLKCRARSGGRADGGQHEVGLAGGVGPAGDGGGQTAHQRLPVVDRDVITDCARFARAIEELARAAARLVGVPGVVVAEVDDAHRVAQATALGHLGGVLVHQPLHGLGRVLALKRFASGVDGRLHLVAHEGPDEVLLGGEVAVQRADTNAGAASDVGHLHLAAVIGERLSRRGEDPLAIAASVRALGPRLVRGGGGGSHLRLMLATSLDNRKRNSVSCANTESEFLFRLEEVMTAAVKQRLANTSSRNLALALLATTQFVLILDIAIVTVALPSIGT